MWQWSMKVPRSSVSLSFTVIVSPIPSAHDSFVSSYGAGGRPSRLTSCWSVPRTCTTCGAPLSFTNVHVSVVPSLGCASTRIGS